MRIIKILVDKKPEYCANCPIHLDCRRGVYKTKRLKNGSNVSAFAPSDDCIIEEISSFINNKY